MSGFRLGIRRAGMNIISITINDTNFQIDDSGTIWIFFRPLPRIQKLYIMMTPIICSQAALYHYTDYADHYQHDLLQHYQNISIPISMWSLYLSCSTLVRAEETAACYLLKTTSATSIQLYHLKIKTEGLCCACEVSWTLFFRIRTSHGLPPREAIVYLLLNFLSIF